MGIFVVQCAQFVVAVVEIWLCYQLLYYTVLEKKYLNKREKVIIWCNIMGVAFLASINRNVAFFSQWMFWGNIVFTFLCTLYITRKNAIVIGGIIISFYSLIALFDCFFAVLSVTYWRSEFIQSVYLGTSIWKILIFLSSRIIVAVCIRKIKNRKDIFKRAIFEYNKLTLFFGCIFVIILQKYQVILIKIILGIDTSSEIRVGISMLTVIVIVSFFEILLFKSMVVQKENQFLIEEEKLVTENHQEILKIIEKNRQMVHDIKHYFVVLKEYEINKEYEKLHTYLEEISGEFNEVNSRVWTGHYLMDFILNRKIGEIEKKGIHFQIDASALLKQPLSDGELCILMGNLLDNAIEACEKIDSDERWIHICIEKQQHMLFIEIANSVQIPPILKNGEIVTSKIDKALHGYGLKSVKNIVYKYDGIVSFYTEGKHLK